MIRLPPRSTRTDTLFPYTTLFRSAAALVLEVNSGNVLAYVGNVFAPEDPEIESYVDVIPAPRRTEEHTSELQSLMRNSYADFCLKKKRKTHKTTTIIVVMRSQNNKK